MAFLSILTGSPAFLAFPPHEPSFAWVFFSQVKPRMIAVSVMSLPPPARKRATRFLGSQRCCMVLGRLRPIPLRAFFMASLFMPVLPTDGAFAATTGARSVTSSSLKSGMAISEIAVALKVCLTVGWAFFWRCISFTFCWGCFCCSGATPASAKSAVPSPPPATYTTNPHIRMRKRVTANSDTKRLLSRRNSRRYRPNADSSGGATM